MMTRIFPGYLKSILLRGFCGKWESYSTKYQDLNNHLLEDNHIPKLGDICEGSEDIIKVKRVSPIIKLNNKVIPLFMFLFPSFSFLHHSKIPVVLKCNHLRDCSLEKNDKWLDCKKWTNFFTPH